jgi:hypothetical protein
MLSFGVCPAQPMVSQPSTNGDWKRSSIQRGLPTGIFITQCGNRDSQRKAMWHHRVQKESHEDYLYHFRHVEAYATQQAC